MNQVNNEIGTLKRLLIHSPDAGIGKIAPSQKQKLLYDDIVYLEKMREEYNEYLLTLLWFLDPETAQKLALAKKTLSHEAYLDCFKPSNKSYFNSESVLEVENLLVKVLHNQSAKDRIVTTICAIEECDFEIQFELLKLDLPQLATVLISGVMKKDGKDTFLFPPIPNLIFTRDIGISIADHLLLTRPAEDARKRESVITKYIAYFELYKQESNPEKGILSEKVLELIEDPMAYLSDESDYVHQAVTIEGGDVMMIAPRHLIVGNSIRTSAQAIDQLTKDLFDLNLVDKVSVVQIPKKRDYMHIDTVFTQLKRDTWIVFNTFSQQELGKEPKHDLVSILTKDTEKEAIDVRIVQFLREPSPSDVGYDVAVNYKLNYLEDLFDDVSKNDFGCEKTRVFYCANGEFPYNEREQWTDACNFLVLKEGVIIGYDRNIETVKMLKNNGFTHIKAQDFVAAMEKGAKLDEIIHGDTVITLSSSELSRARGGTHCMSMPLLRNAIV